MLAWLFGTARDASAVAGANWGWGVVILVALGVLVALLPPANQRR